jgi:hypothetical protein
MDITGYVNPLSLGNEEPTCDGLDEERWIFPDLRGPWLDQAAWGQMRL